MSEEASPLELEKKWQERWSQAGLYDFDVDDASGRRLYVLCMFPYPSGDLHMGHWYIYAPSDTRARYLRMRGYRVFFPIGFDAFGLPAENAAIKRGVHPSVWTHANIERMRGQLRSMGAMFAWNHEIVTCEPDFYRWNQWFFLRFLEQGLAYRKLAPVDWCTSCNTTLAREQVVGEARLCERCDTPVVKKNLRQWFLSTTRYAEELLDFTGMSWPERVQVLQTNWIGRSEGAEIGFPLAAGGEIRVFTTRPDTLWGATALVLAPEHERVEALTTDAQRSAVEAYRSQTARQSETDRLAEGRERTGVALGSYATNPATGEPLPVWIADYVLPDYGLGAIMSVPAHDARDFAFARGQGLPIRSVIAPPGASGGEALAQPHCEMTGVMRCAGPLDGVPVGRGEGQSVQAAIAWLESHGAGARSITYRLRDWLISRQRYWGTPIPIIYCESCGAVPVPEEDLPVTLPIDVDFRESRENPLLRHPTWASVKCPRCSAAARRETDTMDTFVDSSWYQYRYLSPASHTQPFDPERVSWLPVDIYTGGIEHAVMHLMYTRFWTKAMRDLGLARLDEPMKVLFNQGIILGPNSKRMSKTRGNVVNPDELVTQHGSDAVRCFLMFLGPWDQGGPWKSEGMDGIFRWFRRIRELATQDGATGQGAPDSSTPRDVVRKLNQTIRDVTEQLDGFRFNTAIARLMELTTLLGRSRDEIGGSAAWREALERLVLLLAPFAPHLAEECWEALGRPFSVHQQPWPGFSAELAAEDTIEIAVQVNGKLRCSIHVPAGSSEERLERDALAAERVVRELAGRTPRRVIVVPGRLVNVVV